MSSHPHSSDMMQWQWRRSVLSLLITWGWQALVHELSLGKAQPPLKTANKKGKCLNDKYLPDYNKTSWKSAFLHSQPPIKLWLLHATLTLNWWSLKMVPSVQTNSNYHYIKFRSNLFVFLLLHTETSCPDSSIAVNKTNTGSLLGSFVCKPKISCLHHVLTVTHTGMLPWQW